MKTLKIIIASLILVAQSHAFSKDERNLLIALHPTTILVQALGAHNHAKAHHNKIVYIDSSRHGHGRKGKGHYKNHYKGPQGHYKYSSRYDKHHGKGHNRHARYEQLAFRHGHNNHR